MSIQRLQALRCAMAARGLDAALFFSADAHGSEYLHPRDQLRAYFSGFTGSAGDLAVLQNGAALFTDGRYFLQAESELAGSSIELMRIGEPGVPELGAYLAEHLPAGARVGVDARLCGAGRWETLSRELQPHGISLAPESGLAAALWPDRPAPPTAPARLHPAQYAGESVGEKLRRLRQLLLEKQADTYVAAALDDIAWLYNLRGADIPYNPLAFCYAAVERESAYLFIDPSKPQPALKSALREAGVTLLPYTVFYDFLSRYRSRRVLLDPARVNYAICLAMGNATLLAERDPVMLMKARKNEAELAGMREAHRRDGAAMARFLYLLHQECDTLRELSAARRLSALRREAGAFEDSFSPIVAYGPHAAVVHYGATEQSDVPLRKEGLLLVDSGGQYEAGTTDVTRTIALGPLSQEQRAQYTLVLRGMIALAAARFPPCCRGDQLDMLARQPLWQAGLDYNHGTGHGIGSCLCVHEAPVRVHYKGTEPLPLAPGMVLSDEPGVYIPGSHGIRLENQLCVHEDGPGGMLRFETLTLVPFDRHALLPELLTAEETFWLNAYHARVYEEIAPQLNSAERMYLEELTQPTK